jgi:nucleotide-binding universal stress UspA family protein
MFAIRTILHPTDFSARSEQAFQVACGLARVHGARLIVLHVAAPPTVLSAEGVVIPQIEENLLGLEEKLRRIRPADPQVPVVHRLLQGNAAQEILATALATNSDLIVLGTHGRRGLSRFLMGSVAEQVVRRASCPVVTVKTPIPEPRPAEAEMAEARSEAAEVE